MIDTHTGESRQKTFEYIPFAFYRCEVSLTVPVPVSSGSSSVLPLTPLSQLAHEGQNMIFLIAGCTQGLEE